MKNSILYFFLFLSIAWLPMPLTAQAASPKLSWVNTVPLKVEVREVKDASFAVSKYEQMIESISSLEYAYTIEQSSTKSIVYPNPTSNNLTIHSPSPLEKLAIYTTAGKRLQTIPLNSTGPFSISLRNFPAGHYIVKLVNGKESESIKVSKVE